MARTRNESSSTDRICGCFKFCKGHQKPIYKTSYYRHLSQRKKEDALRKQHASTPQQKGDSAVDLRFRHDNASNTSRDVYSPRPMSPIEHDVHADNNSVVDTMPEDLRMQDAHNTIDDYPRYDDSLPAQTPSFGHAYENDGTIDGFSGADGPASVHYTGFVGHQGYRFCRLFCGVAGRNKPGRPQYYGALLKPDNYTGNAAHGDLDAAQMRDPSPELYKQNLAILMSSQTQGRFNDNRRDTGLSGPSILSGLPSNRCLPVPRGFASSFGSLDNASAYDGLGSSSPFGSNDDMFRLGRGQYSTHRSVNSNSGRQTGLDGDVASNPAMLLWYQELKKEICALRAECNKVTSERDKAVASADILQREYSELKREGSDHAMQGTDTTELGNVDKSVGDQDGPGLHPVGTLRRRRSDGDDMDYRARKVQIVEPDSSKLSKQIQKLQQELAKMKDGRQSVPALRLRNIVNKRDKQDEEINMLRAMLMSSEDRIQVCVLEGEALKGKAAYYQKEIGELRGKLSMQDSKIKAAKYRLKQASRVLSVQEIKSSFASSDILSVDDDATSIFSSRDDGESSSSGRQSAARIYRPPTPHPSAFSIREP
ncbi:hypothetical protein CVT24_001606 [Panaeolus cyanescens]|uniref:Uncharacterized protein n=1 Tax=Panaeolus cyanescens TaxID=181874 RepID=A0A409YYU3_9AGAR|nr:hypothetical protein CVT24_001606 [Panaeolus cyanescens]